MSELDNEVIGVNCGGKNAIPVLWEGEAGGSHSQVQSEKDSELARSRVT